MRISNLSGALGAKAPAGTHPPASTASLCAELSGQAPGDDALLSRHGVAAALAPPAAASRREAEPPSPRQGELVQAGRAGPAGGQTRHSAGLSAPPTPHGARGPDPLSAGEHREIVAAFTHCLPNIFGDGLDYGFISGSVARGHAIRHDDIDSFVVLSRDDPERRQLYTRWLERLHARYGMRLDRGYPHEIVGRSQLDDEVLPGLGATHLSLHFNSSKTFDAVTWAEMISGDKTAFVGSRASFAADHVRCSMHVERWRTELHSALRAGGDLADRARHYRREQGRLPAGEADFAPGFAWAELEKYSLPRLMRRVVPLAHGPPPSDASEFFEACVNLPVLHTPRLTLRPLQKSDRDALYELCRLPEVAHFTSWEPFVDPAQAEAFIERQSRRAAQGEWSPWAICSPASSAGEQALMGTIAFTDFDPEARTAEIGFAVHPSRQRRGLCLEAALRVKAFAKDDLRLHRLAANCEEEHEACQHLLLRLGLRFEARLPDRAYKRGKFRTLTTFAEVFTPP